MYYTSNLEGPVPGNTDEEVDDGEQYIGYKLANGQDISLDTPLVSGLHKNELEAEGRCYARQNESPLVFY